jgi:hypothetical protein
MALDSLHNWPGVKDAKFINSLVLGNFRWISQSVLAGNDSLTVNFDLLRPHCSIGASTRVQGPFSKHAAPMQLGEGNSQPLNSFLKAGQFGFRKLLNWVGVRFVAERKARVKAL